MIIAAYIVVVVCFGVLLYSTYQRGVRRGGQQVLAAQAARVLPPAPGSGRVEFVGYPSANEVHIHPAVVAATYVCENDATGIVLFNGTVLGVAGRIGDVEAALGRGC